MLKLNSLWFPCLKKSKNQIQESGASKGEVMLTLPSTSQAKVMILNTDSVHLHLFLAPQICGLINQTNWIIF